MQVVTSLEVDGTCLVSRKLSFESNEGGALLWCMVNTSDVNGARFCKLDDPCIFGESETIASILAM